MLLVYETLTDSFVNEIEDIKEATENGLPLVTRQQVASPDTASPELIIGTTTIDVDGDTLVLASKQDSSNERRRKITTRWVKPGVISQSNDYIGSQLAIVIEAFASTPDTPDGYYIAKTDESNKEGIPTKRYTYLKAAILSVSTVEQGGQDAVSVRAFNMDSVAVTAALAEVTESHQLISSSVDNYEGVPTRVYTYNVGDFDLRSRDGSNLLVINRRNFDTDNFSDGESGTDTIVDGITTLYLQSEEIDNNNTIKVRSQIYSEAGLINLETRPTGNGLLRNSYVFRAVVGDTEGVEISVSTSNVGGFKQITVETILGKDGLSMTATESTGTSDNVPTNTTTEMELDNASTAVVGQIIKITSGAASGDVRIISAVDGNRITVSEPFSSAPGADNFELLPDKLSTDRYNALTGFMIPGVISIGKATALISSNLLHEYYWVSQSPVQKYVEASIVEIITTTATLSSSDYTINGALGLWNPTSWAKTSSTAIGTNFAGTTARSLSATSAKRGFRATLDSSQIVKVTGVAGSSWVEHLADGSTNAVTGSSANGIMIDGDWVIPNGSFLIEVSGGPSEDPIAKTYVLDAKVTPYLEGADGTQYYKKRIIYATI